MKTKRKANKACIIAAADFTAADRTLRAIEKRDGALTREAVFREAKSPKSVLHKYYEWDVEKAAMANWMDTSMRIIQSVAVAVIDDDGEELYTVRAFINVSAEEGEQEFEGRGYISVARAMETPNYRQQIVQDAYDELQSWKNRYDGLKHFAAVMEAIQKTKAPV